MVQETIRFSEDMAEKVESLLEQGIFETKSEFYRFAAETLLVSLIDDHQPDMIDYEKHQKSVREVVGYDEAEKENAASGDDSIEEQSLFYSSAITIRRLAREGDTEAAKEHIDAHYSQDRGEFLLLEALLDYYTNV